MRIVRDGVYYACGFAAAGVALSYWLTPWLGLPCAVLALFCLYFFRDPERVPPAGDVAVAPADGKVVSVREVAQGRTRVSIFLNIFDVHVNRAPVEGEVVDIRYQPGKFLVASREHASLENEQNTLTVRDGQSSVEFAQVAGLVARRIVCWKRVGDHVARGERFGLIRFGSRLDVFLGAEWRVSVAAGERVVAGVSVIAARLAEAPRQA